MTPSVAPQGPLPTLNPLDDISTALIRTAVGQLCRKAGFSRQDHDDLYQEMTLHVLEQAPKYDPSRGNPHAFLQTVISRYARQLKRHRLADRRNAMREETTLQQSVVDGNEKTELAQTLTEDVHARRTGQHANRSPEEANELRMDVEALLAELPPHMQAFARQLQREGMTEIAEANQHSRSGAYRRLAQLRKRLTDKGLGEYVKKF